MDPIWSRNTGRGLGLPLPSKFRTGHLPRIVPISWEDTNSASEVNDMATDSDGEVYGGRYSLDSNIVSKRHDPLQMFPQYHVYPSAETMGNSVYISDDDYHYSSHNENVTWRKELGDQNNQDHKAFDENIIPSAPPFVGPVDEIKQEQFQSSITNHTALRVDSHDFALKDETSKQSNRNVCGASSVSVPARLPRFHASSLGPLHSSVAFGACVRLCQHALAKGCSEANMFLENESALLVSTLGLQQVLPQSVEERRVNHSSEVATKEDTTKPKKVIGKMKVEVGKVRMSPTGCNFSSIKVKPPKMIKLETVKRHLSNAQSKVSSGWQAVRGIPFTPRVPVDSCLSRKSLAYMQATTQYIKQVSGLVKNGLHSTSSTNQETYSCLLRLKTSDEMDTVRMQPGSGETHLFFPDNLGDDLILEVNDSKGNHYGRVLVPLATISEFPNGKLRWWPIYREPEHEHVGKIQLRINYTTSSDDSLKCGGSLTETVLYDIVLEGAMKAQNFQQRNLLLHGNWQWLLNEFASYYGVSDSYTKLRYLSYIMDVATPTADCVSIVYDLLLPVVMKGDLSHLEKRILGEINEKIEQILALVFENYKSLNEQCPSGIMDVFTPATGVAPPVLEPAVKLYQLVHDILSPNAQNKLRGYFQAAVKKRCRRHLTETDEYVSGNQMGSLDVSTSYQKIKALCLNIKNEIFTDIQIQNSNILPSFIDLPNISTAIYSVELASRLKAFLVACPPMGPSLYVKELLIATADLQNDLASWNINIVKNGVDANKLFDSYIIKWIQDKRLSLLETCKKDKVKWSGVRTQYSTNSFVEEMYDCLNETLNDYEVILRRWPGYTFALENAIADIEMALIEALDKKYADVIAPLKKNNTKPKKLRLKCVQRLTKQTTNPYVVPPELGILLNSMKRMLDVLRPKIELQLKPWGSCCTPDDAENVALGDRLREVKVKLRSKYQKYIQAVVEKLLENTRLHKSTKLKKILQKSVVESEIRLKMKPLTEQLTNTMNQLHAIFETHVFIEACRGCWDRMGKDILSFLENRKEKRVFCFLGKRKENHLWDKSSRVVVSILNDTFASQMQQLLGFTLQEKDLEPPPSIAEVRSILGC